MLSKSAKEQKSRKAKVHGEEIIFIIKPLKNVFRKGKIFMAQKDSRGQGFLAEAQKSNSAKVQKNKREEDQKYKERG